MTLLLALTSGAAVANLYYGQPLLHRIAHALGVSDGTGGLLALASSLAAPSQRGSVVGTVMSGLLIGILAAARSAAWWRRPPGGGSASSWQRW